MANTCKYETKNLFPNKKLLNVEERYPIFVDAAKSDGLINISISFNPQ